MRHTNDERRQVPLESSPSSAEAGASGEVYLSDGLAALSIKELKDVARVYDIDVALCVKKEDLVRSLQSNGVSAASSGSSSSSSSKRDPAVNLDEPPLPSPPAAASSDGSSSSTAADPKEDGQDDTDMKMHEDRLRRMLEDEVKRMEPREAVAGAIGGAAILVGGTMATVGVLVVLPVAIGYSQGLAPALSSLLGCSVVVIFVEPVVALYGVSHMLAGVFNTPKTAAMYALGYAYDDVNREWVDPREGRVVGGSAYSLIEEEAALKAEHDTPAATATAAAAASAAAAATVQQSPDASSDADAKNRAARQRPPNARGLGGRRVIESTLYDALDIELDATLGTIKKSYYKMARKWHPDKNRPGDTEAHDKFMRVGVAYQVLSNEKSRRDYDAQGLSETNPDGTPKTGGAPGSAPVDPSTMFTCMFGSETFEPFVGVLRGASLVEHLMQPRTEAEERRSARDAARAARGEEQEARVRSAVRRKEDAAAAAAAVAAAGGAGGAVLRAVASAAAVEAAEDAAAEGVAEAAEAAAAAEEAAEDEAEESGKGVYGGSESQHRLQRKREVQVAVLLAQRVQPYVDACCEEHSLATATAVGGATGRRGGDEADAPGEDKEEEEEEEEEGAVTRKERKDKAVRQWRAAIEDEAKALADAPFGENLLQSLAWSYSNAAHRHPASVTGMPYAFVESSNAALRHAGHYWGLMGSGTNALTTSASMDPHDPASTEALQATTFELMARSTLLDVEYTALAAAKRVLTDGGGSVRGGSRGKGLGLFEALFGSSSRAEEEDESTPGSAPLDMDVVRAARCEALLIVAETYADVKSTNPDPYSWRTAFAQAASR